MRKGLISCILWQILIELVWNGTAWNYLLHTLKSLEEFTKSVRKIVKGFIVLTKFSLAKDFFLMCGSCGDHFAVLMVFNMLSCK